MPKIVELNHISAYQPILLEKGENGLYPFPTMRCGVLPYYQKGNQIVWGCIKSDRVGPVTVAPPAGIQDIIVIKGERRFFIEVGKPFPDLEYDFLQKFVGKFFRDQTYQDILTCLIENKFEIYVENPLVTAIHETREEHGVDLRKGEGRDHSLLNTLFQLPVQKLSGIRGAHAQCFWVASLSKIDGIVLSDTKKIEKKIRRNFGRQFYEQGCWGTLAEFKSALLTARNFPSLSPQTPQQMDLISGVLEAYEETIELLERIELLIRADLKKSAFPRGLHPFFSQPHQKSEQTIKEILTIKTALKNISYETWLVLDLDNTVMESVLEVGSDQWLTNLVDYAVKILDQKEGMRLALLIYGAVQAHVRAKAVELEIVKIIKALQDIGIPVLALTARDIAIKQYTIRQLETIGIDFSRNCIKVNDPSYEEGIIFCNGKNKGQVWQKVIEKCPNHPRHIVMLDDKIRHLERMLIVAKTLKINFLGLRYGFLDEKISAFDMRPANHQLAYLKKYLPRDAQDAIANLQLVPHDFYPASTAFIFSDGFFNCSDHVSLLSGSHVSSEPSMVYFSTK
ncbi:MAG: DUF2608 domain-containing protein [Legionellaceae bacterium]|nr:DUF2608 domain-containing protein [Legionellaceae bacterium]